MDAAEAGAEVWEETFGPTTTVVRYSTEAGLDRILADAPGTLSASIHHGSGEDPLVASLARRVADRSGRVVFNAQTTGVAVSWAQHHDGPWPSTNSLHTSVGLTSIRRFLRPVTWQDAPEAVLPAELRDVPAGVPRRVDGVLVTE